MNSEQKSVFTRIANYAGNNILIYKDNKIYYNETVYVGRNH
jgi:hypothetical protein